MKSKLQKEMRRIRVQLKVHDLAEEKKTILRKELERLRELQIQSVDSN